MGWRPSKYLLDNVSALSEARRLQPGAQRSFWRAFDKAVRRKPLAFAADAVHLWELHVDGEWRASAGGERVEESGRRHVLQGGCIAHDEVREAMSGSGARRKSAYRG